MCVVSYGTETKLWSHSPVVIDDIVRITTAVGEHAPNADAGGLACVLANAVAFTKRTKAEAMARMRENGEGFCWPSGRAGA
jgi:hypothetical protein